MNVLHSRCAGLDVHKKTVVACVRTAATGSKRRTSEVRTFATTTQGLVDLAYWLEACGVKHVAMESTGVYWRPVWSILEERFELMLVNARHVKNVPGRKTDVRDCDWIAQLLECGLLRGSFVPPKAIRDLRDLTRYRKILIRERAHHVNRVAKTLELANIKLSSVVTDIMGKTGRRIIEALIDGVNDVQQLADLACGSVKKKKSQLAEALVGRVTPHYAFMLRQQLEMITFLESQIGQFDEHIEQCMHPYCQAYQRTQTMPGIAQRAAQCILAETGVDMSQFRTAKHFVSWVLVAVKNRV